MALCHYTGAGAKQALALNAKMEIDMNYVPYPKEADIVGGCKVSWLIYQTREEAEQASRAAKHNAVVASSKGYDFGFCCPGEIDELENGLFKVCIP